MNLIKGNPHTLFLEGLFIEERHEYRGPWCIVERLADYRSFFNVENFLTHERIGSDHVPLIMDQLLSYNILCAGSPNGLIFENGEKYIEERDYVALNPRTEKNISRILQWVRGGNLAFIQEASLNMQAYLPEEALWAMVHGRTQGCQFNQAILYPTDLYEIHASFPSGLQHHLNDLKSKYRPQRGRVLVTMVQEKTHSGQLITLINLHLAPGGRGSAKQRHFRAYFTSLIEASIQYTEKCAGTRVIIAGDINNEPMALWDIPIPRSWQGTMVYAPFSCQSYWAGETHLSTNDLIVDLVKVGK